jgi:transcriptional regulator GlxA family with amidase domain
MESDEVSRLRLVAITVFDGVELLDVAGPIQVFSTAARLSRRAAYETVLVGARRGFVRTAAGIPLVAERSWDELPAEVDTLLVPGGAVANADGLQPLIESELVTWLRTDRVQSIRRLVSVCTGAHTLSAAGLLAGRRATTHWATAASLAAEHPDVEVVPDSIFVRAGTVWSSAGVSSGIDLALALVAADYGHDLARRVAQWLVVYLRRPGGQGQFSVFLEPRRSTSARLARVLAWIPGHLPGDLSVEALAGRVGVSPRHLARLFRDELGTTPGAYVERVRVQAAVDQLVQTDALLPTIAAAVGFGSTAPLHRAMNRHYGISPGEYRRRFGATEAA